MANPLTVIMADYTISRISGTATLPISFGFGEGERRAVIVASLSLERLQEMIANRPIPADGSITIADRGGVIIARYPFPEQFMGKEIPEAFTHLLTAAEPGPWTSSARTGLARYIGYMPLSAAPVGLYISVGIGKDQAFAEMNRSSLRAAAVAAVAVLAAGLLSF